jgi:hypothetical protein
VLLDRHEALLRQHQLGLYNVAFAEVQEALTAIKRSGRNPTFNNPYAKLEDLDAAARPIYTEHGFSVRYGTKPHSRDGWMTETLTLAHDGGHSEVIELSGPIDYQSSGARTRTPIQAVGSTVTYLRRYLLMMALNLVPRNDPTDDDGEGQRPRGWIKTPPAPPMDDEVVDYDTQTGEVTEDRAGVIIRALRDAKDDETRQQVRDSYREDYLALSEADRGRVQAEMQRLAKA